MSGTRTGSKLKLVTSTSTGSRANELGVLLRYWRNLRGKSQLDLALDAAMSQRHLSFIESGRSGPSREKLMALAEALDIPLRERNTLLLAAGYAPLYADDAWDAPEMRSVTKALHRMLRQHEPFPAIVMDRYWNVLMANQSAPRFFDCFVDRKTREGRRNLLHLMFDPEGLRPFLANWEQAAEGLLGRVTREAVGRVVDDTTQQLIAALLAYPGRQAQMEGAPSLEHDAGHTAQLRQRRSPPSLLFHDHDGRDAADDRRPGTAHRVHVPGRRGDRTASCRADAQY